MDKKAWQSFFDVHCEVYDKNTFTFATEAECSFLSGILPMGEYVRVLDVGCGTGRHSIGLSSMGYAVTGIDISDGMLEKARGKAANLGLDIRFIRADAAGDFVGELGLLSSFDAVVCLCEGSLGLIGTGEDPIGQASSLFGSFAKALRPGGRLVFTALNALRPIRMYGAREIATGRYDPIRGIEWHSLSEVDSSFKGELSGTMVGEKSFTGAELLLLLKAAGFGQVKLYGGTAGNWGERQLDPDEFEIMGIATKL